MSHVISLAARTTHHTTFERQHQDELNPQGPVGGPRRLRATTGPVTALDADLRGEIDPHSVLAYTSLFVPRGATAEMRGEPTTLAAVRGTAPLHFNAVDALEQSLAREPGGDTEPRVAEYVLWRHYNDALFFAARGARAEARASLLRALARSPQARELLGLRDALAVEAEGPVDVRPFLVGAAPP